MYLWCALFVIVTIKPSNGNYKNRNFECGPYGFTCENPSKLRLCAENNYFGPSFLCPANTICNEESSDVCDNPINYIDPSIRQTLKCRRNERLADPTVPNCKGYILCIQNKNRFQAIKFKCSGNTIFNGITRTCSALDRYKCPLSNTTKVVTHENNRRNDFDEDFSFNYPGLSVNKQRPIDCKNYKFSVRQEGRPASATFFCPSRPVPGERSIRCTVFSNFFCITLERDDEDQFALNAGIANRRPRISV